MVIGLAIMVLPLPFLSALVGADDENYHQHLHYRSCCKNAIALSRTAGTMMVLMVMMQRQWEGCCQMFIDVTMVLVAAVEY